MKQSKAQSEVRKYELALLVKPLLPDDIQSKVVKSLEKLAGEFSGSVTAKLSDQWGKKHLAYSIRKHEEGYYCFFTLEMNPENVVKFNREVKLLPDVLRFITISEDQL